MIPNKLILAPTLALLVAGCAASTPEAPRTSQDVPNQIISARAEGTAKELRERGERALLSQHWQEAVDAFEAVIAGDPKAAHDPHILYDLGLAYEGLGAREKARDRYRELVRRFPDDPNVNNALSREASIDAYLEDWKALGAVGDVLLARKDQGPVERMLGLGARGLSRIELGDESGASHDIQTGLDLVDEHHYGATGQLPVAAAQLKFAHGELRRVRSEKIQLTPVSDDFVVKLELRCSGLLSAQEAFTDAIRSVDPHWAAMSGYRVGEMYRTLHRDLMVIPPPETAKTERDKQLFFGIMHMRYRVLLEKGLDMMGRTLGLAEKVGDDSSWAKRAETAKADMEKTLEAEKAQLKTFPFTEAELTRTLEIMKENLQKKLDAAQKKTAPKKK